MSIVVSVLISILTAVAYTSPLIERKMHDPYIVCHDPPPPAYALPLGYRTYQSSMDLCSAANGERGHNVGCFCSTSRGKLHCDSNVDPRLALATTEWFNRTNDHYASLMEFCDVACYCSDAASARLARESSQRNSLNRVSHPWPNPTATYIGSTNDTLDAEMVDNNQCGSDCSTQADCAGGPDGCLCKTQSEQYVPTKGMVMFAAACMISLGGKRAETSPCPCNGTYVSHTCCDAVDGIVQEPEHFKLGELLNTYQP